MITREEKLKIFFEEIKKDGQISSWYLADKYGISRNATAAALQYARCNGLVQYKVVNHSVKLLLNFELTEKGKAYIFPESFPEPPKKNIITLELLYNMVTDIRKTGFKGSTNEQLRTKYGLSYKFTNKCLRLLQEKGLIRYLVRKKVYVYTANSSLMEFFRMFQEALFNTLRKGIAAIF